MATLGTLNDLVFRIRELSAGRADLLAVTRGERTTKISTTDFLREIHALAVALEEAGLERGERVAIYSANRPEWHVVDFACQLLGAPTVPIDSTLAPEQIAFVLRNSGARWIFFDDQAKRDVLRELWSGLARPPVAVAFEGDATLDDGQSITRLIGDGTRRLGDVPLERFRGRTEQAELGSLIYTQSPAGEIQGVMLSQQNLVANALACGQVFGLEAGDRVTSFLPLSGVFQRALDHLCFLRAASIHYVPSGMDLPKMMLREQPTVLVAPPVVYEMIHTQTEKEIAGYRPWSRRTAEWALAVGARYATTARDGFIGPLLALQRWLAHRMLFQRIHQALGGQLRFAVSGGQPLREEAVRFFEAIGLKLYEGYGLTETSPVLTSNAPETHRKGSVGKPLSDVEVRIAEDGEILVRGPGVMQGYWQNPEATAASIDDSGWFRTGDIGHVDRSGYVFVTDRKHEQIVLANGARVLPRPLEAQLAASPSVDQAVVIGDGRPFAVALLLPAPDLADDQLPERLQEVIDGVNSRIAEPYRIGGFAVLEQPLSVERHELTPTGRIRRNVVAQTYSAMIDRIYSAHESPSPPTSTEGDA